MLVKFEHPSLPPVGIKINETYDMVVSGDETIIKTNNGEVILPTYIAEILFKPLEEIKQKKITKNN